MAAVSRAKLHVSNLYEGTDGKWRCFLRKGSDTAHLSGTGDWPALAIFRALKIPYRDTMNIV